MILGDIILRNASLFGDREAIIFEGRRLTFGMVAERLTRFANALYGRGLRRQDRVAILAQNCSEYIEVFGAGELAGYISVGINYRLAVPEILHALLDCEPSAIVFHARYAQIIEQLRSALPSDIAMYCIEEPVPPWATAYETALAQATSDPPQTRAREDDIAYLVYTSGTTGRPKGVMLGHRGQIETAREKAAAGAVQINHRLLLTMPLYHIGPKSLQLGYHWGGAAIVIERSFDASRVMATVSAEHITAVQLAPAMLQMVLDADDFERHDRSSLLTIHYSAAPIPTPLLRRSMQAFGPILIQAYGPTETGPLGTVFHKAQHVIDGSATETRRLASAGQPSAGCTIRVVRDDGSLCAPLESGEVIIRAPSNMLGYWNRSAETIRVLRDGWVHTGDVGYLDEDNFLFLTDRKKDLIISGGENIYSREVEEVLHAHPSVAEAAVIGVPDERWGEAVKAIVMLARNATVSVEELDAHCRARIAGYKRPKTIDMVGELPRMPSGKVDKKQLREPYWKGRERRV